MFAGKEVILCGGAINSPQLLLLSGIGRTDHLTEMGIETILDRPGVGSDLMDHNEVAISYEIDTKKLIWPAQAATIIDKIDEHLQNYDENEDYWIKLRNYLIKFADTKEQQEGAGGIVLDWYSGIKSDIGHDLHIDCSEGFWFE